MALERQDWLPRPVQEALRLERPGTIHPSTMGLAPGHRVPVTDYGTGRECVSCSTRLSRYNPQTRCSIHAQAHALLGGSLDFDPLA